MDVQQVDPGILLDLKYSSKDNFVGVDVYGCISHCFLQKNTATQLAKANAALKKINPNLSLLVYDGARPRKAQQILWDTLKKPLNQKHWYVANPRIGFHP